MTINERIELVIKELKMNKNSFSVKLNTNPTVIHNIINGRNRPGYELLNKIILSFDNINAEWLITGNGPMLKSDIPIALPAKKESDGIPLIPIDAMAGYGSGDVSVLEYETERFVVPVFKDAEFLIAVRGSSMYPKYNSGDIVACRKLPIDTFFQWNKVYVLDTMQGALIKRVSKSEIADHILIVSDNEKYPPFDLHRSEVRSLAIVLGVIRLE